MEIEIIPCLNDNYSYLIFDRDKKIACVVDPSEAKPIIDVIERNKIDLKYILNTHHHYDHVGGNKELKEKYNSKIVGFKFDKCITPEIEISGKGSGASATPIVNEFGRIIATQITSRGSGYDSTTEASVIDNTNNGSNAELIALVKDGQIDQIVVMRSGFGYCPNLAPIPPEPVGIVTAIYVDKPGIGYTSGDTILIPLPRIGEDTINPDVPGLDTDDPLVSLPVISPGDELKDPGYIIKPVITPGNGSIIDVNIPVNIDAEYNSIPKITINSRNGVGANLIPILTYKQLENTDTSGVVRSGLVGITSVIDCI